MSRHLLGAVVAAGAILVSWGVMVVSPPVPRGVPPVVPSAQPRVPLLRAGIAPAPGGSEGSYVLQHLRASALFTGTGLELRLPSRSQTARALSWNVVGARAVKPQVEKPREAKLHRLVGPRESWERDVPTYGGLRYPGVLPGVDLWFEERAEGVEYGFRAGRGADLRRVELEYAGAREVRVVEEGRALEVDLGEGVLREQGLHCDQERVDGTMKEVGCRFTHARSVGPERWAYAIEVDVEDPERPVVVDPLVLWNTYLGGQAGTLNLLWDIKQNSEGDIFAVGTIGYPAESPAQSNSTRFGVLGGGTDVLVARFRPEGALVWATLIGGDNVESGRALLIGAAGELYVAGTTNTQDFTWTLPDGGVGTSTATYPGNPDVFMARLDPSGRQLAWFVRIDGNGNDIVYDLVQGGPDEVFVIGETTSNTLPSIKGTTVAINGTEGLVARINTQLAQVDWTMLIQGVGADSAFGALYTRNNVLLVTGRGQPASSSAPAGSTDAFLVSIFGASTENPSRKAIGRVGGINSDEEGRALTLNSDGDVVMWGTAAGVDFPGVGAIQGGADLLVSTFGNPLSGTDTTPIPYKKSVLIGGEGLDQLFTLETLTPIPELGEPAAPMYLGGRTFSGNFPGLAGGFDSAVDDTNGDGLVVKVLFDKEPVVEWASAVGGSDGRDEVYALQLDRQNPDRLFMGGATTSTDLRYTNSGYDLSANGGLTDMFLLGVDLVASPRDAGVDAGVDAGLDAGVGMDGGLDAGVDGGTEGPQSPLGWSCGATEAGGGPRALALGVLLGLALFVSRRKPRA